MQCSALYAGVQRWPRRLYTGMSTADVVFVVTLQLLHLQLSGEASNDAWWTVDNGLQMITIKLLM